MEEAAGVVGHGPAGFNGLWGDRSECPGIAVKQTYLKTHVLGPEK